MIKALIVDDERQARNVLKRLLEEQFPHIQLVGEAEDVQSGIEAIQRLSPNLVFLDIQLKDRTSFEILTALPKHTFEVIFITAYDSYALKAFQCAAWGYLLKPVRLSELKQAVDRLEKQLGLQHQKREERLRILIENYEEKGQVRKLIVQHIHGFQVISLTEILYLAGEVNYTRFTLESGEQILVSKTLKDYEHLLSGFGFFRIHQSYLINLRHVKQYTRGEGGTVTMNNNHELTVSRRRKADFLQKFLG